MNKDSPIIIDFDNSFTDKYNNYYSSIIKQKNTFGFFRLNDMQINEKNDLFSFGCMLYYFYYFDGKK